jgi:hypothetical protein
MKVLPNVSRSYSLTHCVICDKELVGRRDKKFCSLECKNTYRVKRSMQNFLATSEIDNRLHRNRTILVELHEEAGKVKFISPRNRLIRKGFSFNHFTSISVNKEGKTYRHLYDYAWMEFSTTDILIVKKLEKPRTQKKTKHSGNTTEKIGSESITEISVK